MTGKAGGFLLIFESTHGVIAGERALREMGQACRIVPVPREISSQCGMAIEIAADQIERALDEIKRRRINCRAQERPPKHPRA